MVANPMFADGIFCFLRNNFPLFFVCWNWKGLNLDTASSLGWSDGK